MKSTRKKEVNVVENLLIIVLDINPAQQFMADEPEDFEQCIDAVIALGNTHLMQSSSNKLAVMSCSNAGADFLYPSMDGSPLEVRQVDGQYEIFTAVETSVKDRLAKVVASMPKGSKPKESMISGALSMALCYINRLSKNVGADDKLYSRILVISGSNECSSQYMVFMNVFFSAHKMGVVLDICAMNRALNVLQQGADLTGGNFIRLNNMEGLLQYLVWVFLPDPKMREKLVLPPKGKVDYRAACFCHLELVDIGYVCSVCLSIYCKYSPICTTCHTIFSHGPPLKMKKKKKT